MQHIDKITGRLGNRLFQFAAVYSLARDNGVDFYMQDEKWFKKYEGEIRQILSHDIGFIPEVSIHVRRGDYVKEFKHFYVNLCETDYYRKAIDMFPNKRFLVFSDDISFCREYFSKNFPERQFLYSEGNSETEDINLMASCSSQIIANSTFSWWAAWLNPNPGKKVVAPSVNNWHPDGIDRTVCPQEWIRI